MLAFLARLNVEYPVYRPNQQVNQKDGLGYLTGFVVPSSLLLRSFVVKKPFGGPIVCSGRSASQGSGLRGIGALFRDPTNLRWEQRAKKHVKILTRPSAAHACTGRFSGDTPRCSIARDGKNARPILFIAERGFDAEYL